MFGLFSKKDPRVKLQKKYEALMKDAFDLSKTDRTASDKKTAEAELIIKEIEAMA